MKKLLIFAFVLTATAAFAQKDTVGLNVPFADGNVSYEKVFNAGKISHQTLFSNANIWVTAHSKGPQTVALADSALFRVISKDTEPIDFSGEYGRTVAGEITMAIQIDCKDGKYRCRISNITMRVRDTGGALINTSANDMMVAIISGRNNIGINKNQVKKALKGINAIVNTTMASLNKTMADNNDF